MAMYAFFFSQIGIKFYYEYNFKNKTYSFVNHDEKLISIATNFSNLKRLNSVARVKLK